MLKKQSLFSTFGAVFLFGLVVAAALLLRSRFTSSHPTIDMVTIPAGEFIMGLTHEQLSYIVETEKNITLPYGHPQLPRPYPPLRVWLDEYKIDRYEVSNGDYQACVAAGACAPVTDEYQCSVQTSCQTDESGREQCTTESICQPGPPAIQTGDRYEFAAATRSYPKVNVTWQEAQTYCQWRGGRLPTEAEWEKAARGTDARLYPWGNQWDASYISRIIAGTTNPDIPATLAKAIPATDQSPYGVFNMAGGVMEWTYDRYYTYSPYHEETRRLGAASTDNTNQYIVRGTIAPVSTLAIVASRSIGGAFGQRFRGFRCVMGSEPRPLAEISQVMPWEPLPEPQPFDPTQAGIVYIPSGEFLYGERVKESRRTYDPISIYLNAFYMDRYEVTQADFALFLQQIGIKFRACYYQDCYYNYPWDELIDLLEKEATLAKPTWYGALAYCTWRGGRLPTEMEWEKANPETRFDFVKEPQHSLYEWTSDLWDTTFPEGKTEKFLLETPPSHQVAARVRRGHHIEDGTSNRAGSYPQLSGAFRCAYDE